MCGGACVYIMLPQQRKYEDKSDESEDQNATNNWLNPKYYNSHFLTKSKVSKIIIDTWNDFIR